MSVDFDKARGATERLGAAVEAELDAGDPQEVFSALVSVLASLIATMPKEMAGNALHTVRTGLADFVEGARSKMQ